MAHHVQSADPDAVLRVLQTLFVGDPGVRLEADISTGDIIALARPSQHRAITATIAEMQRNPEQIVVIPLRVTDPAAAVLLIDKMFSKGQEGGNPKAPIVDGTLQPRQLVVRGNPTQIQQIRNLLQEMGEELAGGGAASRLRQRGNVRVLPIDPATAKLALERISRIWPTMRGNPIRIVCSTVLLRLRMYSTE